MLFVGKGGLGMGNYLVKKGKKNYTGTDGSDTFRTAKKVGSFIIKAKGGDDKIYIGAGGSGEISVGTGRDYVEVTGGRVSKIRLSQGTNTIKITGGQVSSIVGDGKSRKTSDIITVSNQKRRIDITTGGGADSITVNGVHNSLLHKASKATIETNDGNDTITINKGGFNRIKSRYGKDKITINGGSNYVLAGSSNDTIIVNSKYGNYIKGESGYDSIKLGKKAQRCVVEGGSDSDTITVNSTGSGKIGNLVNGGGGHDIINVNYKAGMTLVVDARQSFTENRDTLNWYSSSSELVTFKYYKKNDVMEIYDNFHILGFSKLNKFNFILDSNRSEFTPKKMINQLKDTGSIVISDSKFDINNLLKGYNSIKSYINDAPSTAVGSNTSAKYMGYKGC